MTEQDLVKHLDQARRQLAAAEIELHETLKDRRLTPEQQEMRDDLIRARGRTRCVLDAIEKGALRDDDG